MQMKNRDDEKLQATFLKNIPVAVADGARLLLQHGEAVLSNGDRLISVFDPVSGFIVASMILEKDDGPLQDNEQFKYFFEISLMKYCLNCFPAMDSTLNIAGLYAIRNMSEEEFEARVPDWYKEYRDELKAKVNKDDVKSIEVQPFTPTNADGNTICYFHHSKIREAFGDIFPMPPGSSFTFIGPNFEKVVSDEFDIQRGLDWDIPVTPAGLVSPKTEFEKWLFNAIADSRAKRTGQPLSPSGLAHQIDSDTLSIYVEEAPVGLQYSYKFVVFFQLAVSYDWEVYTFYVG